MVTSFFKIRKKQREIDIKLRNLRVIFTAALIGTLALSPILQANAETKVFQQRSIFDDGNPSNVDPLYDLQEVEIGIFDTDLDTVNFWLHFKSPITQRMFVESTLNEVVAKRMVKRQQMQWTQQGAHYLLQTLLAAQIYWWLHYLFLVVPPVLH